MDLTIEKAKALVRQLRIIQETEENKVYFTFEINLHDMVKDSADVIECLIDKLEEK